VDAEEHQGIVDGASGGLPVDAEERQRIADGASGGLLVNAGRGVGLLEEGRR